MKAEKNSFDLDTVSSLQGAVSSFQAGAETLQLSAGEH